MGEEDVLAGKVKQARGKGNDVVGAITGNPARQAKGKMEKVVGKLQEAIGKSARAKPKTRAG